MKSSIFIVSILFSQIVLAEGMTGSGGSFSIDPNLIDSDSIKLEAVDNIIYTFDLQDIEQQISVESFTSQRIFSIDDAIYTQDIDTAENLLIEGFEAKLTPEN